MTMRRAHFRRFRLSIVLFPAEDLSLRGDSRWDPRAWLDSVHRDAGRVTVTSSLWTWMGQPVLGQRQGVRCLGLGLSTPVALVANEEVAIAGELIRDEAD